MTSEEAGRIMQDAFNRHRQPGRETCGCAEHAVLYAQYLSATAREKGFSPQFFPGVRQWMRSMPVSLSAPKRSRALTPVKGQWRCAGCGRRFAFYTTARKHQATPGRCKGKR